MDEAQFRKSLIDEGYGQTKLVTWDPNHSNESHAHDFTAKGFVTAGSVQIESADGMQDCKQGDTFSMAAGVSHTEKAGAGGARLIVGRK